MATIKPFGSPVKSQVPGSAQAGGFPSSTFGVSAPNASVVGQSIRNLGNSLQNYSLRLDTNLAEEAIVRFERDKNFLFNNPESGYLQTRGRVAHDTADETRENLDKIRRGYAEGLKSAVSRNLFRKNTDSQLLRANQDISRHAAREFEVWEQANIKASIENTLEAAHLHWNDPIRLDVQRDVGLQSTVDLGISLGFALEDEAMQESIEDFDSAFSTGIVEAATAQSAIAGESALDEWQHTIEGPVRTRLADMIKRKKLTEANQETSEQAVLMATDLVNTYADLDDGRARINKIVNDIGDAQLQKKVRAEVRYTLREKEDAEAEKRGSVYDNGLKFVLDGGSVDQFIAASPDDWDLLIATQQQVIRKGVPVETDFELFSELMLKSDSEQALMNPADYIGRLSDNDMRSLISQVNAARNPRTSSVTPQAGRSRNRQVTDAINRMFGTFANRTSDDQKEQANQMYALITGEILFRQKELGVSELSIEEYTNTVNSVIRNAVLETPRFKFFTETFTKELEFTDIPVEEQQEVADYLRSRGDSATAANILKAWEQALTGIEENGRE